MTARFFECKQPARSQPCGAKFHEDDKEDYVEHLAAHGVDTSAFARMPWWEEAHLGTNSSLVHADAARDRVDELVALPVALVHDDDRTGFEREYLPRVEGWAGWLGVAFAAFGTLGFPLVLYWLFG